MKLEHRGQRLSLHDYFFAKSLDALEARRRPGPRHHPLHARQAERRGPRVPRGAGPTSSGRSACRPTPSSARARAVVTDIVFLRKRAPGEPARHADPELAGRRPARHRGGRGRRSTATSSTTPRWCSATWSRKDTLYGGETATASPATGDLADAAPRRRRTAAGVRAHGAGRGHGRTREPPRRSRRRRPERHITEGSFFVGDDRIHLPGRRRRAEPVDLRRHDAQGRRHADRQAARPRSIGSATTPAASCSPRTRAGPRRTATRPAAS